MKELTDEQSRTEFLIRPSADGDASDLDLGELANQLLQIAGKLRENEQPAHAKPNDHANRANSANSANDHSFSQHLASSQSGSRPCGPSQNGPLQAGQPSTSAERNGDRAAYAETARWIYATRRRRTTIFENSELFGEPAWDILLDLYIANAESKPVSVSSACIGSAAPPTTGLRWLGLLADNGLVLREHDPEDQRRVLVRLTEQGLAAMDKYFATGGFPL